MRWRGFAVLLLTAGLTGIAAAQAQQELTATVAIVAPLTGQYEAIGSAMRAAAEEGARAFPADRLIVEDDACDAALAVAAAQRIVSQGAAVVIGHPCSGAAIAAAPVYAQAGIVFITPGARHPDLTDKRAGPNVFRLAGRDDTQGASAAEALLALAGDKAIATLDDRTFHMSTLAKSVSARVTELRGEGAPPTISLQFVSSELDYGKLVGDLLTAGTNAGGIGAIFFAGYPQEAIIVLRQLRAKGITAPFIGSDAVATPELGTALSPDSGEVHVLRPVGAFDANAIGNRTRAALEAWAAASQFAQSHTGAPAPQLTEVLSQSVWQTRSIGPIAFDAKGDARLPSYELCGWKNGTWTKADAPQAAESRPH